jgi:hypothetical protein
LLIVEESQEVERERQYVEREVEVENEIEM